MIYVGIFALGLTLAGVLLAIKLRGGLRLLAILAVCAIFATGSIIAYSVRHLLFLPDGKYRPLARISISEIPHGGTWSAGLDHAFRGRYEIGIMVERLTMEPVDSYDVDLVFEIKIYSDKVLCFSSRSGTKVVPFWGIEGKGFVFTTYEVPRDVPINQPVRFEVKVIQTGPRFAEHYRPTDFFVRKASDK